MVVGYLFNADGRILNRFCVGWNSMIPFLPKELRVFVSLDETRYPCHARGSLEAESITFRSSVFKGNHVYTGLGRPAFTGVASVWFDVLLMFRI